MTHQPTVPPNLNLNVSFNGKTKKEYNIQVAESYKFNICLRLISISGVGRRTKLALK